MLSNNPFAAIGAVLIILLTRYIDIKTDTKQWGKVKHLRGALLRLIGFVPATALDWHSALLWLPYWPTFDGGIGVAKKLGWFYLGTTSWLDRWQHRFKWLVWVKYGLAVAGAIIYLTFKF